MSPDHQAKSLIVAGGHFATCAAVELMRDGKTIAGVPPTEAGFSGIWLVEGDLLGRIVLRDDIRPQARTILENHRVCHFACASHNVRSISAVMELARDLNVPVCQARW